MIRLWRPREAALSEPPDLRLDRQHRPARLAEPAAGAIFRRRRHRKSARQPSPEHGFLHDPRLAPPEPMIEPTQGFLEIADRRPGDAEMWIAVRPRTEYPMPRHLDPGQRAQHGRGERWIGPTRGQQHRACDPRVIAGNRLREPGLVAPWVSEPRLSHRS